MKQFLLLLCCALLSPVTSAQVAYSVKDLEIFNSILSDAEEMHLSDSAIACIVTHVGRQLLGRSYVGGVLDKPEKECVVIDLDELDCVTFLESTIAMSVIIKEHRTNFEDFCNELKLLRYRDGEMNGYTSRLHYFCEWIENNQQKGLIKNITDSIGGKPLVKDIHFMSENRTKYQPLKTDSSVATLIKIERQISAMNKYYVPKDEIKQCEAKILDGDLIAITTTVEGLDIAHVGIAIHVNNVLHLMHASSLNKQVEISELPLFEMIQNKAIWSGIMVARLTN